MLSRKTQNYRQNSKPANMAPLCAFDGRSSAEPRQTKINDRKQIASMQNSHKNVQ